MSASGFTLLRATRKTRSLPGRRSSAVVIGGSIAGLLAARALVDHFDQVTILERDRLPGVPGPRKGVPQARFIHVLLVRGQTILERFFPGIGADLEATGAPCIDWMQDVLWYSATGWGHRFPSDLSSFNCSRDLLEGTVGRRLSAEADLRFLDGCEVTGLMAEGEPKRVVGVKIRRRGGSATGAGSEEDLSADLVVDAGGRTSRTPDWLAALGYGLPAETVVNSYLGYATRWFEPPPGLGDDWVS